MGTDLHKKWHLQNILSCPAMKSLLQKRTGFHCSTKFSTHRLSEMYEWNYLLWCGKLPLKVMLPQMWQLTSFMLLFLSRRTGVEFHCCPRRIREFQLSIIPNIKVMTSSFTRIRFNHREKSIVVLIIIHSQGYFQKVTAQTAATIFFLLEVYFSEISIRKGVSKYNCDI